MTAPTLSEQNGATRAIEPFPAPTHALWDLDTFAREDQPPESDPVPDWIHALSEQEANRLLSILTDSGVRRPSLEQFFQNITNPLPRKRLDKIIDELCSPLYCELRAKHLRTWMARHGKEGLRETEGAVIHRPGVLRMHERYDLILPNLQRIFAQHFAHSSTPKEDRVLLDVGTWDGGILTKCKNHFGTLIGVEPNEERFQALYRQHAREFRVYQTTMAQLMEQSPRGFPCSDAILLSHVVYFLDRKTDEDMRALLWSKSIALAPGGIAIVILNDTVPTPGSRAHLRQAFGVKGEVDPERYRRFLETRGIATRTLRSTLKAQTPQGRYALKDILRFSIPGEQRNNLSAIEQYLDFLQGKQNGVYHHTLSFLVLYEDASTAPPVRQQSFVDPLRGSVRQSAAALAAPPHPAAAATSPSGSTSVWKPSDRVTKVEDPYTLSPAEILAQLSLITEETGGVNEGKLTTVLEAAGIPRALYADWLAHCGELRQIAVQLKRIESTGGGPLCGKIPPLVRDHLLARIRKEAGDDPPSDAFLQRVGISRQQYRKWTAPRRREVHPADAAARRKTLPIAIPQPKWLPEPVSPAPCPPPVTIPTAQAPAAPHPQMEAPAAPAVSPSPVKAQPRSPIVTPTLEPAATTPAIAPPPPPTSQPDLAALQRFLAERGRLIALLNDHPLASPPGP